MRTTLGSRPIARSIVSIHNGANAVKNTVRVPVLVDSGAQATVVNAGHVANLEKMVGPFKKVRGKMRTASGTVEVTYLKNVKICLDDACANVNLIAAPNLPHSLLVGTDFLKGAHCKMDFKKGEMSCGGRKMKFSMEG